MLPGRKAVEEERFTITDPRMRMEKILVEQKTLNGKINAWEIEEGKILEGVVNELLIVLSGCHCSLLIFFADD